MGNSTSQDAGFDNEAYSDESDSDVEENGEHPDKLTRQISLDTSAESIDPRVSIDHREYIYPFENLIFEGGGTKGISYVGAVMELEEMGLLKQVKRFAGASIGSLIAGLLAVGFSGEEVGAVLGIPMKKEILDHSCGYFSLLPNMLRNFGWNPGNGILRWFRMRMFEATQNSDITFKEVYDKFGTELCVIITNVTQMTVKYCHVKTTPDLPIALAVRMSTAIPGLMAARKHTFSGQTDIYVDGGLLCNYPIHCFDGWWLSLTPKDSFLKKLQPLSKLSEICDNSNRFGEWNEKTIGFVLYSDDEPEVFRHKLEGRQGVDLLPFPKTKLARKYEKAFKLRKIKLSKSKSVLKACDAFLKALSDHDVDESSTISAKELEMAFQDPSFKRRYRKRLFGRDVTAEEAFYIIRDDKLETHGGSGRRKTLTNRNVTEKTPIKNALHSSVREEDTREIQYDKIEKFLDTKGVNMTSRLVGFEKTDVNDFSDFMASVSDCMVTNLKRVFMKENDIDRTVGINTGFLHTTDFTFETQDFEYAKQQGRRSLVAFLKEYVVKNNPPRKPSLQQETSVEKTTSVAENQS